MSHLFSPITVRGATFASRVVAAPMWQYEGRRGFPTDWHLVNLGRMAAGGAGLVMQEGTTIEKRGRGTPGDLGIWDDCYIEPLSRLVNVIKSNGAVPGIQLMHPGRKARRQSSWSGGKSLEPSPEIWDWDEWEIMGPSALAPYPGYPVPREMSLADIRRVVDAFGQAARRALAAGYEVIELHGAHGYLLHAFLSEAANKRGDIYGGSYQNRARLMLEAIEAVRGAWPADKPLFVRLSCIDEAGWTIEDTIRLVRLMMPLGVDVIDCSTGGLGGSPISEIKTYYGYQVQHAAALRRETGVLTAAVGLIVHAGHAESIVANGEADFVCLGRELLYNPNWPLDAAQKLGASPNFDNVHPRTGFWLKKRNTAFEGFQPSTYGR